MASLFWSWIFILHLIRPGLAQVNHEILAQRAAEAITTHGLTKAEKARNTFIALAVAFTVVLVAVIVAVIALLFRSKNKAADAESGVVATEQVEKPHWFMVDSKKDWWSINLNLHPATPQKQAEHPDGSRIERLKAALNKKAAKTGKPLLPVHNDKPQSELPIQSIPDISPMYPDVLERGYRAPIYPVQQQQPPELPSPPQIPALTMTVYEGEKPQPRSPPKAVVTQGLARTFARHDRRGLPRSAAGRRKSFLMRGNQLRHPFLPLKDSDAQVLSAPKTAAVGAPSLTHKYTMSKPRAAPKPPTTAPLLAPPHPPKQVGKRVPPPLRLDTPTERRVRFGLPTSPLSGLLSSPRFRKRGESPAF